MSPNTKKLSMTNTKKEMLDEYNRLLKQLDEQTTAQETPEQVVAEKQKELVLKVADEATTETVIEGIGRLKIDLGKTLSKVSEELESELNKLNSVRQAIKIKEQELEEIYGLQRSANSFAALVEAQNQSRQKFDEEQTQKKEALDFEISEQRKRWTAEKSKADEEHKEYLKDIKQKREREKAEYEYQLSRDRKQMTDRLQDEKVGLEKEISEKRNAFEVEMVSREKAIAESEGELKELRAKSDVFPKELDTAVKKAKAEAENTVTRNFESQIALLKQEYAGEQQVLTTKIASLEKTVEEQHKRISHLTEQLETSYQKVQDVALKAIDGASKEKVVVQTSSETGRSGD